MSIELHVSSDTTLSKNQIEKIKARLPEFHRATSQIGHGNSQASFTLQTLQEFASPLQKMKQCIIQINQRYSALEESHFKIEKTRLEMKKIQFNDDEESKLKIKKFESNMTYTNIMMENTLRELGMFQDLYDEIRESNNIPINWTEKDFEDQEISHMIRSAFRIAIQSITTTGAVSHSALDYFEQIGINPTIAEMKARQYIVDSREKAQKGINLTINDYYDFLDMMAVEFKDAYKLALKRIGVSKIGSADFVNSGITEPDK